MLGLLAILLLVSALAFLGLWAAVKIREPWIGLAAGPIEETQIALSGESRERFGKFHLAGNPRRKKSCSRGQWQRNCLAGEFAQAPIPNRWRAEWPSLRSLPAGDSSVLIGGLGAGDRLRMIRTGWDRQGLTADRHLTSDQREDISAGLQDSAFGLIALAVAVVAILTWLFRRRKR